MTLKTLLLATVALCGLAAAPALAREVPPNIHLMAGHGVLTGVHTKSHVVNPSLTNFTSSVTFTGTLSTASAYKVKTAVVGEAWFAGTCTEPSSKQKWVKLPKKTAYAKISTGTTTGALASGACPGDTFTFYDVYYDLSTKKAVGKTDTFTGTLEALKFEKAYNLYLNSTFEISIAS